jgi:transposase
LSVAQREKLRSLLQRGPPASGYESELWTLRRVADLIESKFGVVYHPCHVWRLLEKMGWSCQKPERRARESDEAEIEHWRRRRWPHIKKRPTGRP